MPDTRASGSLLIRRESGRVRALFADRQFLAYFIARQSSLLAYGIEAVAIAWQVFLLRHQAYDLGLVGLVLFLPQIVLAIPAGLLADRFDRRAVVISAALTEAASLLIFIGLALRHVPSVAVYLAAVAVVGIAHAMGTPAERSLLASIVRSEQFARAAAFNSSIGQFTNIGAPALAGLLVAWNVPAAFGIAALGYLITAMSYGFLAAREVVPEPLPLSRAAIEGVRFIFSRKIVLGAISLDLFAVLFGGATALLPVYATQILHVGAAGFGALRSAPAVGAALVAFFISRRPLHRRLGPLLLWCVAGFGVATIVFGISKNLGLSLVALALTGGFDVVSVVIRNLLVQLSTPDAMRGRVSAVENIFIGASNELGSFESGMLAAWIGTEAAVVVGGVGTLLVIGLWAAAFPALRTLDRLATTPSVSPSPAD